MSFGNAVPVRVYAAVFAVLIVLTGVTTGISFIDLGGALNAVTALTIAAGKAVLVVWYFMHVRSSGRLTRIFLLGGFFWLGILVVLVMSDYLTRDWPVLPGP